MLPRWGSSGPHGPVRGTMTPKRLKLRKPPEPAYGRQLPQRGSI